jgi:hypothetical protein
MEPNAAFVAGLQIWLVFSNSTLLGSHGFRGVRAIMSAPAKRITGAEKSEHWRLSPET